MFYIAALETERTAHQQKDPDIDNSNAVVVMNLIKINAAEGNNSRVKMYSSYDDIRHSDSNLLQDERIASGRQDSKLPKTPVTGPQFLCCQLQNVESSLQRLKCSRMRIAVASSAFQRRRERRSDGRYLTASLAVLLWAALLPVSAAIGRWTQTSHREDDISFYTFCAFP